MTVEQIESRLLLSAAVAASMPPTVVTGVAVSVSATGATLKATVNPEGSATAVKFQYSTENYFPPVASNVGSGFHYPDGVAVDAAGDLFVYNDNTSTVTETFPNGTAKSLGLAAGPGIAVDAAGDVFAADVTTIKEFLPNGTTRNLGTGISYATGVAVDGAGDVFLTDGNANAVKEILPNGTMKTLFSGSPVATLALDPQGNVVVDGGGLLTRIQPDGTIKSVQLKLGVSDIGMAISPTGDIFVSSEVNGGVFQVDFTGHYEIYQSGFDRPEGLAFDAAGDLFVADYYGDHIVRLSVPSVAATPSPLNGTMTTAVSGTITGLSPNTTYYYYVSACNSAGINRGFESSFRTLGPAPTGSISGAVFNDVNGNGKLDGSDSGLPARTVYIDANNNGKFDASEVSTTTGSAPSPAGSYKFSGLAAGTYKVRQVLPAGWQQIMPASDFGQTITLAAGQNIGGENFLDSAPGSIAGSIFNDVNVNGRLDAVETELASRTVYLDANNNGRLDIGETTATTNSSGIYSFGGLAAGAYKVRQVLPTGWQQVAPARNFGQTLSLARGQNLTSKNFADATEGTIAGSLFNDANGNGKRDAGEAGLSGRTIYLDSNNNGKLDTGETTTLTTAAGVYTFTGLIAGTYKVRQILPAGWQQTAPASNFGQSVALAVGQNVTGKDFADRQVGGSLVAVIVKPIAITKP